MTRVNSMIEWSCQYCAKPIPDGEGYIYVDKALIRKNAARKTQWKTEHPGPLISYADLSTLPSRAPWIVCHEKCDPDIDGDSYWFDVERARTTESLFSWTLHLMDKTWISETDWSRFVHAKTDLSHV